MNSKYVKRGEIYYYDFGKPNGSVQGDRRPVIVIQDHRYNTKSASTTVVAAITSKNKPTLPSHIRLDERCGLKKPSIALLEQVQTVDVSKLTKCIGKVTDSYTLNALSKALSATFSIKINAQIRCLCDECRSRYIVNSSSFVLRRISQYSKEKYRCDECDDIGYIYSLTAKEYR